MRSGTESSAPLTVTPANFARQGATTTGHPVGCSCMFCYRERKRLRDEAEADRLERELISWLQPACNRLVPTPL